MGMLGFRCPDDIDVLVREEASKKGVYINQLLRDIVEKNYSENSRSDNPGPDVELDGRVTRIQEINDQIKELESEKKPYFNVLFFHDEKEKNDEINEMIESLKMQKNELIKSLSIEKDKIKDALAARRKISVDGQ